MKFLSLVFAIFVTLKVDASITLSSAIYSQNFKTVCVRWSSLDKSGDIQFSNSQNTNLVHKISKKMYPVSGIYQFDSNKLLWEIKDETLGDCRPLDDGHYAIFFESNGFVFMRDSHLIKKFSIENFCKDREDRSFQDLKYSGEINEDKKEFGFRACDKIHIVDIVSGKMLEGQTYSVLIDSLLIGLVGIAFLALELIGIWKTFEKGNYPGLFGFIPFYNVYVMVMIAGLSPWILLLFLVPGANAILPFFIHFKIARKFQFGFIASIVMAIFHWIILYPVIGFGKSVHEDNMKKLEKERV